jgi:hypothetical protein
MPGLRNEVEARSGERSPLLDEPVFESSGSGRGRIKKAPSARDCSVSSKSMPP